MPSVKGYVFYLMHLRISLSIIDLGYWWSLDFVKPLPITKRHNKYVLMMIECLSKWKELVALPDKFTEGATYVFFY